MEIANNMRMIRRILTRTRLRHRLRLGFTTDDEKGYGLEEVKVDSQGLMWFRVGITKLILRPGMMI